ncbi:MAG: hypothetical protein AAF682_05255 [Planctomycetota bacterium]
MAEPSEALGPDPPKPEPGPKRVEEPVPDLEAVPDDEPKRRRRGRLARWVEGRAERVLKSAVSSGADKIEERAAEVVGSLYDQKADDLEDRAVRAMRRAIHEESERIRSVIEHSVEVKRREVRLSLLVLVGAAIVYLILFWITREPPAAA